MNALNTDGVLSRNGRDGRRTVDAQGGECLQIRLDTSASAGIGSGYR